MVEDFKSAMDEKMTELEDKHSLQRELLIKDYYGHSAIDHHARHGDKLQRILNNKLQRNTIRPVLPNKEDQLDGHQDIESGENPHFETPRERHSFEAPRELKESPRLVEETPVDAFEMEEGDTSDIEQSDDINSLEHSDDISAPLVV